MSITVYRSSAKDLSEYSKQDLEKENQKLKSEIAALKNRLDSLCRDIHPYDKEFHYGNGSTFVCPCCRMTGSRSFIECQLRKNSVSKFWYAPWRGEYSVNYFLIKCYWCKSSYAMHLPDEMRV